MIKFLYRLNSSYDKLPEPKRFLIFMALIIPAILAAGSGQYVEAMIVGWVWIMIMLTSRMSYLHGWLNSGKINNE